MFSDPGFPSFPNLVRLDITLPVTENDQDDLLRLFPLLEGCTQVQRLTLRWQVHSYDRVHIHDGGFVLTRGPSTLRILEFFAPRRQLPFAAYVDCMEAGWAPSCKIRFDSNWWTVVEREQWTELMEKRSRRARRRQRWELSVKEGTDGERANGTKLCCIRYNLQRDTSTAESEEKGRARPSAGDDDGARALGKLCRVR